MVPCKRMLWTLLFKPPELDAKVCGVLLKIHADRSQSPLLPNFDLRDLVRVKMMSIFLQSYCLVNIRGLHNFVNPSNPTPKHCHIIFVAICVTKTEVADGPVLEDSISVQCS